MTRWVYLAFAGMVLNGTVLITQKVVGALYPRAAADKFLALAFLVSAMICWLYVVVARKPPKLADVVLGAAAGVISNVGNVFLLRCLSWGKASLVFPIVFGASMVIVTLVSWAVFKEKLSTRGVCAVFVGIASIVVLNLS